MLIVDSCKRMILKSKYFNIDVVCMIHNLDDTIKCHEKLCLDFYLFILTTLMIPSPNLAHMPGGMCMYLNTKTDL